MGGGAPSLFGSEMCVATAATAREGGWGGARTGITPPALLASLMWNPCAGDVEGGWRGHAPANGVERGTGGGSIRILLLGALLRKTRRCGAWQTLDHSKHCADCPRVRGRKAGHGGEPIRVARRSDHAAHAIWTHTSQLRTAYAEKKIPWPNLTAQEMTDLLVYLQNPPQVSHAAAAFSLAAPDAGMALFESKGCVACHYGKLALDGRRAQSTLTSPAAAMWKMRFRCCRCRRS
jgi:hypothetical protein